MATQPVLSKAISGSNIGKQIVNSKITIDDSTGQIGSTATGVAPLSVSSGILVSNLNSDQLDGLEATSFLRTDASSSTDGNSRVVTIAAGDDLDVNGDLLAGGASSVVLPTSGISGAGTGSGLDADQVDGLEANQFLRADADDNFTGNLTGSAAAGIDMSGAGISDGLKTPTNAGIPGGTPEDGAVVVDTTNNDMYFAVGGSWIQLGTASASGVSSVTGGDAVTASPTTGAVQLGWDTTFNHTGTEAETGNWEFDGTVAIDGTLDIDSGATVTWNLTTVITNLNADKLDGQDASSFLRSDASDATAGTGVVLTIATGDDLDVNGDLLAGGASSVVLPTSGISGAGTGSGLDADQLDGLEATDFIKADGSVSLTADWDAGAHEIRAETFESDVATGTAPLTIASTTLVDNLNADLLDSQEGSYYLDFANHSIAGEAQGDILIRGAAGWQRLAAGTAGYVLTSGGAGANPSWTTGGGTMDDWSIDADSGGPKTLQDGNTLDIAGEAGVLSTALSGASSPFTLTISVDALGIDTAKIAADAVDTTKIDWGSGANQVDSSEIPVDSAFSPANYTRPGTYTGITDDLDGIDAALGNIAAGINFKGPVFSRYQLQDGSGVRVTQGQAVKFTGQPSSGDVFITYDGTTTRTYTAGTDYTIGATLDDSVRNLAAAIEADGSRICRAQAVTFDDLDSSNLVMTLAATNTGATYETYAYSSSGSGNSWSNQPEYTAQFDGTSDDTTTMPNAQQAATNFSTEISNSALNDGDTYVCRSCGSWERNDGDDDQWVTILVPPSQSFSAGDGISIDTLSVPNEISVDLASNSGLAFSSGDLTVNLDGSTLQLGASGLSINPGTDVGWTTSQTFNAGLATDTITEDTSDTGVTVDGCLIKDGIAAAADKVRNDDHTAAPAGGISTGQVCYVDTSKQFNLANATSSAGGFGSVVGVALNTAAQNNTVQIGTGGELDVLCTSGFTPGTTIDEGDPVYISTTGGSVTPSPGTSVGNWIQEVGVITDLLSYDGTSNLTIRIEWAPKEASLIV